MLPERTRKTRHLIDLLIVLVLVACTPGDRPASEDGPFSEEPVADSAPSAVLAPLELPSVPGALAPDFSLSADGVRLTWLEPTEGGHALRSAVLEGEAWGAPSTVTAGAGFFANWADLPRAVHAADGTLYAHWLEKLGDETYAYGVQLARSGDGGATWSALGLLHDDASPTEHGFVSYAALPGGGVQAFWLDGRAMLTGGSMHLRTTRLDGYLLDGYLLDGEEADGASTLLDDRVCECCATDAASTAAGPVVVYRDRGDTEIRDISVVRASAEGWSQPTRIHDDGWTIFGCPVNGPAIAADGDRVAVAWFTAAQDVAKVQVALSADGGATFGEPISIDDAEPLGRVDVVMARDGDALVSWLGSTAEGGEIRWRRVGRDGERGPVQTVATTTTSRGAGVPRMVRHGDALLFAWTEDAEPRRLRTGRVDLASRGAS